MYEEIQVKRKVDWKSAFTKLGVLALFIILLAIIISIPTKGSYAQSEFEYNLKAFMTASKKYFNDNLPAEVGSVSTVKLNTLIDEKYIKHVDLESDKCNKEQSYAKITKLSKTEYSVYAYLECNSNQSSSIDTIKK